MEGQDAMSFSAITFDIRGCVAYIVLNRPDAANGLNIPMGKDLMHAAIECDENPDIRAVVLTGSGKMFSAGGDLKMFSESGSSLNKALKEMTVYCHAAASRFMRMNAPLVTAVNGAAAGMGMSFALCGDLVLAAESASFVAAYTAAALSPDGGMTYLLPRMIGMARAKEMMLMNRKLNAHEALDWGLVNQVVPNDELMDRAETIAGSFASGPTLSLGSVKKLINESFSETLESQMEREARSIVEMSRTGDAAEGVSAFLEKRRPVFNGQ